MHATCPPISLYQHRGDVVDVTITTNQPASSFDDLVLAIANDLAVEPDHITDGTGSVLAQFHIPDNHALVVGAHRYEIRLPNVADIGWRTLGTGICNVLPEPTPAPTP